MNFKRIFGLLIFVGLLVMVFSLPSFAKSGTLVFLETNDLQSAVVPFKAKVYVDGKKVKKMVGGLARVATFYKKNLEEYGDRVILVSGGDDTIGPLYYYFYGKPEYRGMSLAGYSVVAPGNHEFDLGPAVYAEAIDNASFDIISANLKVKYPLLVGKIKPYVIKKMGNLKVGFFGLMTSELPVVSNAGEGVSVEGDYVKVAREMINTLKKEGADVIVAVTHIGLSEDIKLAKAVSGIAVILGGHSHSLTKEAKVVEGPNGWKTVVVQAGARAMYVGKLVAPIENGKVMIDKMKWNIVLMDEKIPSDPVVSAYLEPMIKAMDEKLSAPIGESLVDLDARKKAVRAGESNLGDFIADAFRWKFKGDIALTNGGGIRGDKIYPKGSISYKTLTQIHPFGNTVVIANLTGEDIKKVLEISASALIGPNDNYDGKKRTPTGGFLQVSGLKVTYDLTKPPTIIDNTGKVEKWGNRVVKVEVLKNGEWTSLDPKATYKVITNSWTGHGGDKYFIFKQKGVYDTTMPIVDVMAEYIKYLGGKIAPKVDGRIVILR